MNWIDAHQLLLGGLFVALTGAAILLDLVLVLVLRVKSISLRTWLATEAHPTLLVAGTLATVGVCALVSGSPVLLFFAAFLGGHLFAHW